VIKVLICVDAVPPEHPHVGGIWLTANPMIASTARGHTAFAIAPLALGPDDAGAGVAAAQSFVTLFRALLMSPLMAAKFVQDAPVAIAAAVADAIACSALQPMVATGVVVELGQPVRPSVSPRANNVNDRNFIPFLLVWF